ncbi:MAG: hypothetical protein KBD78_08830 [Oligoflexales bacterium]|nr:hypothetical protein [Oligoflexales bacterium]
MAVLIKPIAPRRQHCVCLFFILTISQVFILTNAQTLFAAKIELGSGLAAVEQGDDRQRPSAYLHIGFSDFYFSRFYIYGQDFGPVKERTYNLAFYRRFGVFKSHYLQAAYGVSALMESNSINNPENAGANSDSTENNFNLGASLGVYFVYPVKRMLFQLGWDSHLYLAGLEGGILLSTARKQYLSAGVAVDF